MRLDGGCCAMPDEIPVQKRAPYAREAALAVKRAALVAEGRPTAGFDAVTAELREQERRMVAGMSQWASLVVATWAREHAAELAVLPSVVRERLLIEAVVAYLYGYGLVEPAPPDEEAGLHPLDFGEAVPAHLHPDVAGAAAAFQRIRPR